MNYKEEFGKQIKDIRQGAMVKGNSHSQSGIPVYQAGGSMQEPIAEIEGGGVTAEGVAVDGGERVFSVEDTQMMNQMAQQYLQTQDQQLLMQLGQFVVESIMKQEQNAQQEEGMAQEATDEEIAQMGNNYMQNE